MSVKITPKKAIATLTLWVWEIIKYSYRKKWIHLEMWKFALASSISELCNLYGHYNRTENKQLSPVSPIEIPAYTCL